MNKTISRFMQLESAGGILLMFAAVLAMILANSPAQGLYQLLLNTPVEIKIANLEIAKPLLLWINDGLMAVFFFLVGLELKRELLEGELSDVKNIVLPGVGAVGGMLVPALVYVFFNYDDPKAISGWAIPAATDIAFALGIMALLGNRVPVSLKVFLLALAIIDDLGVVVIIAFFYTSDLSVLALVIGFVMTGVLFLLNAKHVSKIRWYLLVGFILWVSVLQSGVHATLAGVVLGFAIPLKGNKGERSPLKHMEHALHPYVAFLILPIFAFANAGISLEGVSLDSLSTTLPLGVAFGLLIGKPLGIFSFSYIAVKSGVAKLPTGVNMIHIFAVSVLCGIGFTMSIFISSLAFGSAYPEFDKLARLGILMGSTLAAVIGYILLSVSLPKKAKA